MKYSTLSFGEMDLINIGNKPLHYEYETESNVNCMLSVKSRFRFHVSMARQMSREVGQLPHTKTVITAFDGILHI